MKYLITTILKRTNGAIIFSPITDTEICDSYVGALRWMVGELRWIRNLGYRFVKMPNHRPSRYGREWLFKLVYYTGSGEYILQISRISENCQH